MTGLYANRLPAETFTAWLWDAKSIPLDVSAATTLEEAVELAAHQCQHKDWYSVVQRTPTRSVEHVCYVKQGKGRWMRKPGSAHAVMFKPLEAEIKISREVIRLEPALRFTATRTADVVGLDRSLIDG